MTEEKVTYCRICEVYCGMIATVEDGRVTKLRPDDDHVVSKGYACPKGVSFPEVTHDPDRILHPLRKTARGWVQVSWDDAIAEIAERLNGIRAAHGPDAIALYTGNPSGYSYNHRMFSSGWIHSIGSRNSFGAGSQDNLADFLSSKLLFGAAFRQPIPDLARTTYAMVVATNPVVSQGTLVHTVDAKARLREIRARGGKLVVIDPRRTETAKLADEHHFIRPGTDAFLLLAMTRTILEEGLADAGFLARHTADADWLRDAVAPFTPEVAAERTGVDAGTIRRLAREFAAADGACAFGRVVCGPYGTLAAWSLDVLNVVTGNLDRPGGVIFSEGPIDLAAIVAQLGLDEYGKHRSRVGDHPGVLGELPAGVLADEITTPGRGQIRALVVTAGNPVLSIADGPKLAEAMRQLECTVVLDFYMSETAALADFILPCTTWLERADFPIFHGNLMTEPYVQWTDAVIPPLGEAREEWEIFTLLSDAMGLTFMDNRLVALGRRVAGLLGIRWSPRFVADVMLRTGPFGDRWLPWGDGINLKRIQAHPHGLRLRDPRTGILEKMLLTPDRKVHFRHPAIEGEIARLRDSAPESDADAAFPFRLIGRRDVRSNNSWLHNVPHLMRGDRCRRLRIHPDDAARLGLGDGDRAVVRSRAGAVEVDVRVTDEVMPGVVSLPHGWGHHGVRRGVAEKDPGPNANALVDRRAIEPLAGMAWLNGFPVAVERVRAAAAG